MRGPSHTSFAGDRLPSIGMPVLVGTWNRGTMIASRFARLLLLLVCQDSSKTLGNMAFSHLACISS